MVQSPEKELRFTRARQARVFYILATIHLIAGFLISLAALLPEPYGVHEMRAYLWALIPSSIGFSIFFKIALHCTKHAYLILTPLGLEIFPFYRPSKNLQLIYWAEIKSIESDGNQIILHTNEEKTSGIILSLKPIQEHLRSAFLVALENRVGHQNDH